MARRIYALILLLALLVPSLAACGDSGTTAQPTSASQAQPTSAGQAQPTSAAGTQPGDTAGTAGGAGDVSKIQVEEGATLRVSSWGDPAEQQVNQASFDRFKQIYPGVTIVYEPRPSEFQTTMKADMSAGNAPDVFYVDTSLMTAFAPNGLLLPLDDYLAQTGASLDDYLGELTTLWQLDGKTYAMPKDFGAVALFVNNDLAQAAGIEPASIKSWDDLRAAAEKMATGEGNGKTYGLCVASEIQRVGAFMLQQPGQDTMVQESSATFNNEQSAAAIDLLYGIYTAGHGATAAEMGTDWCGQAFGEGKAAMVHEGGWMINYLAQNAPDVNYTAVPLPIPSGGEQDTLIFTNGWGANANSEYPKAAAALVLFLTSAQNQRPIMESGFALPTVTTLLEDPFFDSHPNEKVLAEAGSYGTLADTIYSREKKDDVIQKINQAMERIWLGQQEPAAALDQAEQEVNELLGQ